MTTLINFIGSPSAGKSTLSTMLFGELKARDYEVELVQEFAKTLVYAGKPIGKYDQLSILAHEVRNASNLFGKVDYIVGDSGPLSAAFYQHYYWGSDSLIEPCKEFYKFAKEDGVRVVNIFIDRKFKYRTKGRFQTEEEAEEVRRQLLNWLPENGFEFHYLKVPVKERIPEILKILGIPELEGLGEKECLEV